MKHVLSVVFTWLPTLALAVFAACVLGACQRDLAPPLVEVHDVSPRELELGDRVEVRGAGFPQGHTARITFRGSLYRPGQSPVHGASIETTGVVQATDRIDLSFGDSLEERFAGRGDRAAHTTFRGDVEVAFASSAPGAPPLVGTLRATTLDVRPSQTGSAVIEARSAEGARVLAFLGVTPGVASARGIPIETVAKGSPADRAGIQAGDVLAEIDGVRLLDTADVVPASARAMDVLVRHGEGGLEETRTIPLVGYSADRIPAEYAPALLLVGLALAWLLVLVAPGPASLGALELRVASRLRASSLRVLAAELFGRGPRVLAALLASVLVGTFALGPHVVDPDVDGAILLVSALALLAVSRVAVAPAGFGAALRAAGDVAVHGALLALALAGAVILEGAMQLGELVRIQGAAPWEVAATQKPAAAALAFAYLGALFAMLRRREGAPRPPSNIELLGRLGLFVACALAVAVFFGGWRVPGLTPSSSLGLHVVAALAFVAKTWALVAALRGGLALATPWTACDARAFVLRRLLPALGVAAVLVLAARRLAPGSAFEVACGATVAAAILLFSVRSALRVRDAMGRPEPHASPFL